MIPTAVLLAVITQHPVIRADDLLAKLGSPRYAARELVGRELVRLGRYALPALRRGERHPDLEISVRCQRLIPLAEAEAVRQRVAFLLDPPLRPVPTDVPLARRFLAATGDTREARERYVEMYVAHAKLLGEIDRAGAAGGKVFWGWVDQLLQPPEGASPGLQMDGRPPPPRPCVSGADVTLFWFLSADPGVRAEKCPGLRRVAAFFDGPAVRDVPAKVRASPAMQRLLLTWLVGPRSFDDPFAEATCLKAGFQLAADLNLPGTRATALRVALDRDQWTCGRAAALLALARVGRKDDVPRLAALISDDTMAGAGSAGGNPGVTVLIGDLALGVCVTLDGGLMAPFGFPNARLMAKQPPDLFHYGFPPDGKARAAARTKWAAWDAARTLIPGGKR